MKYRTLICRLCLVKLNFDVWDIYNEFLDSKFNPKMWNLFDNIFFPI